MKIIQQRDKLLSNFEVYQHICDVQRENQWGFTIPPPEKKRKHKFNPQLLDLEIITRDLGQYLTKIGQGNDVETNSFVQLMLYLNALELEIIEKLMIVNSLPRSLVTLYAIIEECEERFTTEVCEEILQNIERLFPSGVVAEDEEMQDAQEDQIHENPEEEEDEDAFVDDMQLEHENYAKKVQEEKDIDEVDS